MPVSSKEHAVEANEGIEALGVQPCDRRADEGLRGVGVHHLGDLPVALQQEPEVVHLVPAVGDRPHAGDRIVHRLDDLHDRVHVAQVRLPAQEVLHGLHLAQDAGLPDVPPDQHLDRDGAAEALLHHRLGEADVRVGLEIREQVQLALQERHAGGAKGEDHRSDDDDRPVALRHESTDTAGQTAGRPGRRLSPRPSRGQEGEHRRHEGQRYEQGEKDAEGGEEAELPDHPEVGPEDERQESREGGDRGEENGEYHRSEGGLRVPHSIR
jgi:hypothetical protein